MDDDLEDELLGEYEEEKDWTDKKAIFSEIAGIALPAIGCQFCVLLQEIINIIFVSSFTEDTNAKIAGIGMGNTLIVVFGVGSYVGLNSALNTLAA